MNARFLRRALISVVFPLLLVSDAVSETIVDEFGSAGSGPGQFIGMNGIAVDAIGRIYVTDPGNSRIQVFEADGTFVLQFGSSGSGDGQFTWPSAPNGIAVDRGLERIYVADSGGDRIQVFDLGGVFQDKWGSSGTGDGQFNRPGQIALDRDGNVYVADALNDRVQVFDPSGIFLGKFGSNGTGDGQFNIVTGVALDSAGQIYVSDSLNDRVQVFSPSGTFLFKFGSYGPGNGQFYRPSHLGIAGALYVADAFNDRVQVFTLDGVYIDQFPSGPDGPFGLAVDRWGNVFVDRDYSVRIVTIDEDYDGLYDVWETVGIDLDGDSTIDLNLPALGADPRRKDAFIEIDYLDCSVAGGDCASGDTHSHEPKAAAVAEVLQAFADAPVTNPDGSTGITLHIEVDDAIAHQDTLNLGCFAGATDFDTLKAAHFDTDRRLAYHYAIFAHQQTATSTSSGCGETPGNDFMVTLGGWNVGEGDEDGDGLDDEHVGTLRQQSGTLMHEFGHNLGLGHGGNECVNYKPNYLSIMSYRYQFRGILPSRRLDYSSETLDGLDENDLDETVGINDGLDDTLYDCPNGTVRTGSGSGAIDWDCDASATGTSVSVNINGDCTDTVDDNCGACDAGEAGKLATLTGANDWDNLELNFRNSRGFWGGVHVAVVDVPDMDYDLYRLRNLNLPPVANAGPDLKVECTAPTGTSAILNGSASYDPDGDALAYGWTGSFGTLAGQVVATPPLVLGDHPVLLTVDDGRGGSDVDGLKVTVEDTTPPELTVPDDLLVECSGPSGQAVDIGVAVATDACCGSASLSNDAPALFPLGETLVTWTAMDCHGLTTQAVQKVLVQDTIPPQLSVRARPHTLWPVNHKIVNVAVGWTVTDICDANPQVVLASAVSDEPDDAPGGGDGHTVNDIQGADIGTPDTAIALRAERQGGGDGRVYTLTYTATDQSDNSADADATVGVPHNR